LLWLKLTAIATLFLVGMGIAEGRQPKGKPRDLESVRKELQKRRKIAEEKARKEKELLRRLEETSRRAGEVEGELRALEAEYREISKRMEELQREIATFEVRCKGLQHRLKRRLLTLYRLKRGGLLEVLLGSDSYGELLRRLRFLTILLSVDRRLLEESHRLIEKKEDKWRALREVQRQLAEKGRQIEELRRSFKEKEGEVKRLLAAIRAEKREELRKIAELKRRERALRQLMDRLQKGRAGKRMEGVRGKLPPPVDGKPVSLPGRKGIAFFCKEGTEIRAVRDGRVVFASWFDGYGNLMIIDHGRGYHTVYAHAKRLLKEVGEEVKAGEVIALVGSTGSAQRPMLYFELRYRGRCKSPTQWLALPRKR